MTKFVTVKSVLESPAVVALEEGHDGLTFRVTRDGESQTFGKLRSDGVFVRHLMIESVAKRLGLQVDDEGILISQIEN